MQRPERRKNLSPTARALERQLSDAQLYALRERERFGWELAFVRKPMFQAPVAVLVDDTRRNHALLEADGTIIEQASVPIRS